METSTPSLWKAAAPPRNGLRLTHDIDCDVCVVGAGIAGLTVAYQMLAAGKCVVILEAQPEFSSGETSYTSAHLTSQLDDGFARLKSIRGTDAVRLAHASHAAAIDSIEELAGREGIACDFARLDGYLYAARPDDWKTLEAELAAAHEAGVPVESVGEVPWRGNLVGRALRFPHQAIFHPLKYTAGLANTVQRLGGLIYTDARVVEFDGGPSPSVKVSSNVRVQSGAIVLATNTPINSGIGINARLAAYTSYVIALPVPIEDVTPGLYWDTEDPYHYVRFAVDHHGDALLIAGGEDHKTGQDRKPGDHWQRLESWARERFPDLGAVRHRWDGQVFETLDGLGLIGKLRDKIYVVTGDSGMGLTHGTLAGRLIADLILGRENEWRDLYDPHRLSVATTGTLLRENVNVAAQYLDWFSLGQSQENLASGEGVVVRRGLSMIALSRLESGQLCALSATCPHYGGIVHWNGADQTWDCPCHGSRFAADGRVLHGPATQNLRRLELAVPERELEPV